jgi:hypothetical protein
MTKESVLKLAKEIELYEAPFDILLAMVDSLFPATTKAETSCYNYTIGRMPYGWVFSVINNWRGWMDKGYEHKFGAYKIPAHCLAAFLEYVVKNNIEPEKLYEK